MSRCKFHPEDYTVGWVCALPIELAAAQEDSNASNDTNLYTLGRIGKHNVVIACLPAGQVGTNPAAVIAARMKSRFTSISFGLMVGIGGGVPSHKADIRLGDVVISQPENRIGGVVQYDMGKTMPHRCERTGSLNSPPEILLNALSKLKTNRIRGMSTLADHLSTLSRSPVFTSEGAGPDILFESTYEHLGGDTCERCDRDRQVKRNSRGNQEIAVHYGTIASGDQVMRDGQSRDWVSQELGGVLCFEMEAAGLMNSFPCLVLRGICDYADSHKSKTWQPYASATAAACAKEILLIIPEDGVAKTRRVPGAILSETLRCAVEGVQLRPFLQMLSTQDPEQHTSRVSVDFNQPRFHWIFKNLDFKHWVQSSHSQVLWLSGPPECSLYEVSSHIVQPDNAILRPPRCILYFSCSLLVKEKEITARLVHRLVHQLICWSSTQKMSIIKAFLYTLREKLVKRREQHSERREKTLKLREKTSEWHHQFDTSFKEDDPPHATIEQMLEAASANDHWAALQAALDIEQESEMLIVIDGLDDVQDHKNDFLHSVGEFVRYLLGRTPKTKVLLTSGPRPDGKVVFPEFPCIKYDKERKWIWMHNQYQKWMEADTSRVLYLQGKPGSGKSTLTKYFAKHLQEREPNVKSAIVATFFYSFREGEAQRSHYNMLRSILYAILDQDEAFFYHYFQCEYRRQLRKSGGGGLLRWDSSSLKSLLSSLRDHTVAERLYLIIDAVDESDYNDRREILDFRPVATLERRISEFHSFIRLQDETQLDILNFANAFLQRVEFPQFIEQARKYVVDNANGVFLWVRLVGEELLAYDEQGCAEEDVFEFLKSLPTELDEFYRRMLDKMVGRTEKEHKDGVKMFQFVLFAQRPLTVCELLHAFGVPDNPETKFLASDESFQKRIPHQRRITHCGGNFLEIKQLDGKATVQAMHQTVREFFPRDNGYVATSKFRMVANDAHVSISITCIRCVHYLNQRSLASYALMHLKDHLDRCHGDPHVASLTSQFIDELTRTSGGAVYLLEGWARSHLKKALLSSQASDAAEGFRDRLLHTAVRNELSEATKVLVLAGANIESEDENGRTPLLQASEAGHLAVLQMLLDFQVDIDRRDWLGLTADQEGRIVLSWAARNRHKTVVWFLLEHEADVDT
ncbi:hypothetical protein LCI18_011225 [Fusarium solani-melongenae]|uniref:Uncharacterized protein n=1 Tax=Fusarium solani subsp. cucurbitae TaxID=2747967 RepID=A0ACD3ZGE1_FUSSC|nr:hypothetical protein LCI18_011225 [Fusarium solani-melongenae]